MNLSKSILITGSSKNLGKYLANYYSKKNFNVIGVSKTKKKNLKKNNFICDLGNEKKTNLFFKKLKKKFNKIDTIISCAGFSKRTYRKNETSKDWVNAFNNNFFCFVNLLNAYSNYYKKKPTKIIIISSIVSDKITQAPITYSVAKSALNYYGQIKAKELAKFNIKINILMPGNILMKNNNWKKKIDKNKEKVMNYIKLNVPLNQFCQPLQIAEICDYLIGKSGDNITGSKFVIDGGESL